MKAVILQNNKNIDESEDEDILNASFKTFPDMDEDALSVLYETCQSEQDIEDELEDLEVMGTFQLDIAIYKQVDECVRKNTLSTLLNMRRQIDISNLDSNETVIEGIIKKLLEFIALGKDKKIMFGIPCDVFSENTSLIDFLVCNLYILKTQELSIHEKHQLDLLSSKISDLVSTGTYMSEEPLQFLPPDLIEKRSKYLSSLKQIVCDSIEKDGEENVIKDVIVERDNKFYCVQCPEESVITPAKFLSNPEFQNLDEALKIGEGDDVIRIQDGKYHDIKVRLQMTFPISNSEKIVMTLSSEKADKPENASSFGKTMVHMDDKSCEIFSKYLKELEKEPRISKVVEAAKSFVEEKNGKQSEPFSVLEEVSISKCSHFNRQR
ncbi:hypothetical protein [Wolbachia endosymbiont of Drosophila tsacasi]|uniref:hypothetical protein n=1 Tax=Wolbachia endosymbiont of Drosophila tsacasi TaxID=3002579 RepID=UPI0023A97B95|nr:hypothetical protein [Wolbachia endosymbiont of Drosophila tsacasi]MDE5061748.1 hypothetical protein [Wolbachia endosymbiont of Drosophila tsacasi]